MTRWEVADARVAGALATWAGGAVFDRTALVLERPAAPGSYLIVRRYVGTEAEGPEVTAEEWADLQRGGEAMELAGAPAPVPGAWLWIARPRLPLESDRVRDDLSRQQVLVGEPLLGPAGEWAYLVRELDSAGLREAWASELEREARDLAVKGRWPAAERRADAAFMVEPSTTVPRAALQAWTLRHTQGAAAAEGFVHMLRASYGDAFADEVGQRISRLDGPDFRRRRMNAQRRAWLATPPFEDAA
jgi:hypothetical protein